MSAKKKYLAVVLGLAAVSVAGAQGGQGGGFAGGGMQQGRIAQEYDGSVEWIDRTLARYLNGNEVKNLMTPGEYSEWTVSLKAGQVVVAEAWSDAFDPALEIVDADEKVLKANDDRYPGDQRPLLFWRCASDGEYRVRARCFQDKFGGQFFVRSNVYRSLDAVPDGTVDFMVSPEEFFLVRIPLKAGEVRRLAFQTPRGYQVASAYTAISPIGLPDIGLTAAWTSVLGNAVMASVDGDYYVLCQASSQRDGKVKLKTATQKIAAMDQSGSARSGSAETNTAAMWSFSAKQGEIIQVTSPSLHLNAYYLLDEQPDISKYDLKDEKKNPFFPRVPNAEEPVKGPAFVELPGRARDPRVRVFVVKRDCDLWLACNGAGPNESQYAVTIAPATSDFVATSANNGHLRIGYTDYWQFDAKSGDVMTLKASVDGFAQRVVVRDPDLAEVWSNVAAPDQDKFDWNMIVRKPGRYLVAVSALGDGAAGSYTLEREVFAARTFSKEVPAIGDFSTGEVEVWKFTANPGDPVLLRWKSPTWPYTISVTDENGNSLSLPLTPVDNSNRFGILTVNEQRTYVVVLVSQRGQRPSYSIELLDLPGLKGGP